MYPIINVRLCLICFANGTISRRFPTKLTKCPVYFLEEGSKVQKRIFPSPEVTENVVQLKRRGT